MTTNEQKIYLILRLLQIENHDLTARAQAFEKVLLENPEIHQKYETARLEALRNRRPSNSLEEDLEALHQNLHPENPA